MSGRSLEPYCPIPVPHDAADRIVDYDKPSLDNEVWRYARRLADAAARPPRQPTYIARRARRACLLVGAALAGVAAGMQVGGSGALPLDSGAWRQLIAQVSPWDPMRPPTPPVLVAGATLASTGRTVPEDPARAPTMPALAASVTLTPTAPTAAGAAVPEPVIAADASARARAFGRAPPARAGRATDWFAPGPVEDVIPAATIDQIPAGAATRGAPPEPAPLPPSATAPYRVQLALLRDPRNAGPVWRSFVKAVQPLAPGLERFVEATRTKHGLRHLVQAGPFDDAGAAEAVCLRVITAGGDCFVVPPPA